LTGQVNFAAFKDDYASNFSPDWPQFAVDPSYFLNIGWLPEHILASVPAADQDSSEFSRMPVGDGPYMLKEWNPGQEIILEASDQPFPLGEPKVKTIIFRFFGDGSAIKAALQNGEIDAALGTPSGLTEKDGQDLNAIEATGRYKVDWIPQFNNERIDINLSHFPMDDVRIRQALYYALDRQAINDVQYFGKKALLAVPLPPGLSWAYPPEDQITIYNYDPDKARALIAEAGWDCSAFPCTKEVDGELKSLEFTFLTTDRQDRIAVAQMLQSMWRQVGIGVNLQFLYGRGLFQNCSAGGPLYCRTFDLAMYGSSSDDAATFFTQYSCGAIPNESNNWSGQNNPGWCNETANSALNESENNPEVALSREKRLPYITSFFKEMTNEIPQIFLYGASWPYPHLVGWKNFKPGATQYSLPTWNSWEWEVYK
jgi:peptide/nickel transport system substrate-binding protein